MPQPSNEGRVGSSLPLVSYFLKRSCTIDDAVIASISINEGRIQI